MATQMVASFEVTRTGLLAPDGRLAPDAPGWAHERDQLVALYRAMVLTRTFDAKAVALQRTGRLGTFASSLGQEAVAVGIGAAMRKDDVLVPSFREQGAMFWRGVDPADILAFWGGDERGSAWSEPAEDFPICVPVGTHAPHAAGVAMAIRLRGESRAVVCVFGDGATSKGDVYEALNLAGVKRLPVVFVINNNGWAISVPRAAQTAAATLAQKAIAGGFPGEQVDGNDVVAVRVAVERALERARTGTGPTHIEALTYRLSDHTTADDARRYRTDEDVRGHWKEEPIGRLRQLLVAAHGWVKADEEGVIQDSARIVEAAVEAYLARDTQPATSMFDHLFAQLPEPLASQRAAALAEAGPEPAP